MSGIAHNPDNPDHVAVTGERTRRRWYNCIICGLSWPATQIRFWNGAPYGVPCECYLDLVDLDRGPIVTHDTESIVDPG